MKLCRQLFDFTDDSRHNIYSPWTQVRIPTPPETSPCYVPRATFPVLRATAPDLDAFDLNPAFFQIQVRHVAVALQSFRQDLHFAEVRGVKTVIKDLQHHTCTVAKSMRASAPDFLEKFSSAMQVSIRTAANPWPSNHPKNRLHFYWNDLMILFHPFSIFTCFH